MADLLISPQAYTTEGGVPRKLLAGVFLVVMLTSMGVFLATAHEEPLQTGDQKARAELGKPEAVTPLAKGQERSVDEAADRARSELEQADKDRREAAPVSAGPSLQQPSMPVPGLPAQGGVSSLPELRRSGPSELDAASAERERASRSAASVVFDESASTAGGGHGDSALPIAGGGGLGKRHVAPGRLAVGARGPGIAGASSEDLRHRLAAYEGGADEDGPQERIARMLGAMPGMAGTAQASPDRSSRQKAWAAEMAAPGSDAVLRPVPAASDLLLYQGTVIPCVLTRRINSELPGPITARVSMNVYDSRTSRKLLLPQGALLVGAYSNDVQDGQERLQFAFTRLRMPDGSTYELPGAGGADAAGQSGVAGQVDRHVLRRFGSALLLGLLADRVTKSSALPRGGTNGAGGLSATGQVFVDTARAELERHKTVPPTITVEEGARLNVEVVRDIDFPHVYGGSE